MTLKQLYLGVETKLRVRLFTETKPDAQIPWWIKLWEGAQSQL